MPFLALTNIDEQPVLVNSDHVQIIEPNGSRTKLTFSGGSHLRVTEAYADVIARLAPTPVADSAETAPLSPTPAPEENGAAVDHPARSREKK